MPREETKTAIERELFVAKESLVCSTMAVNCPFIIEILSKHLCKNNFVRAADASMPDECASLSSGSHVLPAEALRVQPKRHFN